MITSYTTSLVLISRSEQKSRGNNFICVCSRLSAFSPVSCLLCFMPLTSTAVTCGGGAAGAEIMSINQSNCVYVCCRCTGSTRVSACHSVVPALTIPALWVRDEVSSSFRHKTFQYPFKRASNYQTDNYTHQEEDEWLVVWMWAFILLSTLRWWAPETEREGEDGWRVHASQSSLTDTSWGQTYR